MAQLAIQAGRQDGRGNIDEACASYGQPDKAITLIGRGIAKGGLKNPDEATLRLALANYEAGNKDAAQMTLRGLART